MGKENEIYFKDEQIVIRSMQESDIKKITNGFLKQGWNRSIEDFKGYYNEQKSGTIDVFVAEYEGEIAGYIILVHKIMAGPYIDENTAEIKDFNVFIKFQNRGIGSKLMDVAEEAASKRYSCVTIGVGLHNGYGSAQRMYVKRRYIPDGSGVWYKDKNHPQYADCNNDDDLILYFKKEF